MYAIVNSGGKQYKVREGEMFRVEKLPGEVGAPVTFDQVLMVSDGDNVEIGRPVVDGMTVEGHIVEQDRAKKIIVFKYKRRKRYRRKQGHRQYYTAVKVDSIGSGRLAEKSPAETEPAESPTLQEKQDVQEKSEE